GVAVVVVDVLLDDAAVGLVAPVRLLRLAVEAVADAGTPPAVQRALPAVEVNAALGASGMDHHLQLARREGGGRGLLVRRRLQRRLIADGDRPAQDRDGVGLAADFVPAAHVAEEEDARFGMVADGAGALGHLVHAVLGGLLDGDGAGGAGAAEALGAVGHVVPLVVGDAIEREERDPERAVAHGPAAAHGVAGAGGVGRLDAHGVGRLGLLRQGETGGLGEGGEALGDVGAEHPLQVAGIGLENLGGGAVAVLSEREGQVSGHGSTSLGWLGRASLPCLIVVLT